MEAITPDPKAKEEEKKEQTKENLEEESREEAMAQFRLLPAYKYIMDSIDEKIKDVTDTRILAKNFGKIKSDVITELGTLGIASLMSAQPLEELKEEIEG